MKQCILATSYATIVYRKRVSVSFYEHFTFIRCQLTKGKNGKNLVYQV